MERVVRLRFSSAEMPGHLSPRQRATVWLDAVSNSSIGHDVDCPDHDGFHGSCETLLLGSCVITSAHANAITLQRRKRHIARDGNDSCLVLIHMGAGQVGASQYGRDVNLQPGQAVLLDCRDEVMSYSRDDGKALGIYIPRSAVDDLGIDLQSHMAVALDAQNQALRLLASYSTSLLETSAPSAPDVVSLTELHMRDAFALMLGASIESINHSRSRSVAAMRLAALKRIIRQNARSPDFTFASFTRLSGMSPRSIQKLFYDFNTSFSDELARERIDFALQILGDQENSGRLITEIAYECGFSDLSTFNRAFKRMHGMTPTQARKTG